MLCPAHMLGDTFPIRHSSGVGAAHVECGGLPVLSDVEGPPLFAARACPCVLLL
jgi:hypothetical protein